MLVEILNHAETKDGRGVELYGRSSDGAFTSCTVRNWCARWVVGGCAGGWINKQNARELQIHDGLGLLSSDRTATLASQHFPVVSVVHTEVSRDLSKPTHAQRRDRVFTSPSSSDTLAKTVAQSENTDDMDLGGEWRDLCDCAHHACRGVV